MEKTVESFNLGGDIATSGTSKSRRAQQHGQSMASKRNLDELSIDSATNEKIYIKTSPVMSKREAASQPRPHFRIDWRQLSYYQRPSSFLSAWFEGSRGAGDGSILNEQQGQNFSPPDNLSMKDKRHQQSKCILNSLDGCFKSGQLSAILGPSGAGKSTFLSTLFGSKQEGAFGKTKVTWLGEETKEVKRRPIRIAVLPQKDHLLHHLTVYETLMFASKIKNSISQDTKRPKGFHRQNVKRVAKMLKLIECLDTRCGKLSGGQYKRVSIGQELLSEPEVIILDEPTSGLDASTCLTTVQTLKSIVTKHPISIILTIHQPDTDVFNLFDHVYVIAQGGVAIYEGPPQDITGTLKRVNLSMPSANYNPARFIVEQAFMACDVPASAASVAVPLADSAGGAHNNTPFTEPSGEKNPNSTFEDESDSDDQDELEQGKQSQNYIKRSLLSLTEAISGKEAISGTKQRDKKPLLNIGIQTLDGKLITTDQLAREQARHLQVERWNLLRRLNEIQKERYRGLEISSDNCSSSSEDGSSPRALGPKPPLIGAHYLQEKYNQGGLVKEHHEKSSAKSDYSSEGWSEGEQRRFDAASGYSTTHLNNRMSPSKATSLAHLPGSLLKSHSGGGEGASGGRIGSSRSVNVDAGLLAVSSDCDPSMKEKISGGRSLQTLSLRPPSMVVTQATGLVVSDRESVLSEEEEEEDGEGEEEQKFVVNFPPLELGRLKGASTVSMTTPTGGGAGAGRMKRQFDKRLSAKHNCSKQKDYPIWYHSLLLTHRTWLSIVRDPIFFGIQAIMHITIPLLLALIFGAEQEEGCPRIGNFDLVDFAYSDTENIIQGTVKAIRQSIGNIGVNFFEMFCLSFSINCITALVFPSDMHVLLKEYRNGWYSLRSYFFGRTIADLPVPVILHSLGMALLYFLTGQPRSISRFSALIVLVILASLIAQSVGLTIGAVLMKSSQSAVLAAAGIVAPFFALSGFIVRIHTLPVAAQFAAKCSYLSHLLNGFIILRYGFGRCQCNLEDFENNEAHPIPSNLHTMASMWIGTYSNEYADSKAMAASANSNRTNIDPNIDIVDKMMTAFKMANSYGHQIKTCDDVIPYAMLDFNVRDQDIYWCFTMLIIMVLVSRTITFTAIYYKIRSFT